MTTKTVSAQQRWMDTEVDLTTGDELILKASGQWTNGGQPAYYAGPEGFAGVTYDKATLKSANLAALIGKVGDQGEPFFVGSAYQGTSPSTGRLYLQINDEDNDLQVQPSGTGAGPLVPDGCTCKSTTKTMTSPSPTTTAR